MRETAKRVYLKPVEDDSWPPRGGHQSLWSVRRSAHTWRPATDVFEAKDAYRVVVEIAGMRGADIQVTFEARMLVIRGERRESEAHKAYHQMEIPYGDFETRVELPQPVQAGAIEASYTDGFLRVTLPKVKPTRVDIE